MLKPFIPEFLKWTLPSLNLVRTIVPNLKGSQSKIKIELQTVWILIWIQGSSWRVQRGRSFATISGFQGDILVQILDLPILSIHLHFSLSSRQGEVSQLRETFSPKSPSRMTPGIYTVCIGIYTSLQG